MANPAGNSIREMTSTRLALSFALGFGTVTSRVTLSVSKAPKGLSPASSCQKKKQTTKKKKKLLIDEVFKQAVGTRCIFKIITDRICH